MDDPTETNRNPDADPDDDTESELDDESAETAPQGELNEGEGSRSAARRYDAAAERGASDPKRVDELANKAKEALDGPEGDGLREADKQGKMGKPVQRVGGEKGG